MLPWHHCCLVSGLNTEKQRMNDNVFIPWGPYFGNVSVYTSADFSLIFL